MSGYEKLKEEILIDCNSRNACGCFNLNGCDKPHATNGEKSCFHKYCNKFKWIIDRAKNYEDNLGIPWQNILDSWENNRTYWYMNYYQDCNQPILSNNNVKVFNSIGQFMQSIEKKEFRCPACGKITTNPYECTNKMCNWKIYGLMGDLGKGVFVYCKDKCIGDNIFMPISWEKQK